MERRSPEAPSARQDPSHPIALGARMHRIIGGWFAVSDLVAWPLRVFSLMVAVLFPFVGPLHARMAQQPITMLGMAGTCALWLIVAVGAHALLRRRALGLAPVLAPAIVLAFSGQPTWALAFAFIWAVVFAAPFLLVLSRSLPGAASRPKARS